MWFWVLKNLFCIMFYNVFCRFTYPKRPQILHVNYNAPRCKLLGVTCKLQWPRLRIRQFGVWIWFVCSTFSFRKLIQHRRTHWWASNFRDGFDSEMLKQSNIWSRAYRLMSASFPKCCGNTPRYVAIIVLPRGLPQSSRSCFSMIAMIHGSLAWGILLVLQTWR